MGLTNILKICHADFPTPVRGLLLKVDATRDLTKHYPLGAGVSSLNGTGKHSSKPIVNEVARIVWVSSELGTNIILRLAIIEMIK